MTTTFTGGLFALGSSDPRLISDRATEDGLDVYVISTPTGVGVSEFFESARSVLPLDPPLSFNNWDAFIDSLDSGIADIGSPGVVIIWADALNLKRASRGDFRIALACLARVVEHVANPEWTPHPKMLSVFVNIKQGDYSAEQWPYVVLGDGSSP